MGRSAVPSTLNKAAFVFVHKEMMIALCPYHDFNCHLLPESISGTELNGFFHCSFCRFNLVGMLRADG